MCVANPTLLAFRHSPGRWAGERYIRPASIKKTDHLHTLPCISLYLFLLAFFFSLGAVAESSFFALRSRYKRDPNGISCRFLSLAGLLIGHRSVIARLRWERESGCILEVGNATKNVPPDVFFSSSQKQTFPGNFGVQRSELHSHLVCFLSPSWFRVFLENLCRLYRAGLLFLLFFRRRGNAEQFPPPGCLRAVIAYIYSNLRGR